MKCNFRVDTRPHDDEKCHFHAEIHDGPAVQQARRHYEVRSVQLSSLLMQRTCGLNERTSGLSARTNDFVNETKSPAPRSFSFGPVLLRSKRRGRVRSPGGGAR